MRWEEQVRWSARVSRRGQWCGESCQQHPRPRSRRGTESTKRATEPRDLMRRDCRGVAQLTAPARPGPPHEEFADSRSLDRSRIVDSGEWVCLPGVVGRGPASANNQPQRSAPPHAQLEESGAADRRPSRGPGVPLGAALLRCRPQGDPSPADGQLMTVAVRWPTGRDVAPEGVCVLPKWGHAPVFSFLQGRSGEECLSWEKTGGMVGPGSLAKSFQPRVLPFTHAKRTQTRRQPLGNAPQTPITKCKRPWQQRRNQRRRSYAAPRRRRSSPSTSAYQSGLKEFKYPASPFIRMGSTPKSTHSSSRYG